MRKKRCDGPAMMTRGGQGPIRGLCPGADPRIAHPGTIEYPAQRKHLSYMVHYISRDTIGDT